MCFKRSLLCSCSAFLSLSYPVTNDAVGDSVDTQSRGGGGSIITCLCFQTLTSQCISYFLSLSYLGTNETVGDSVDTQSCGGGGGCRGAAFCAAHAQMRR
jgi:hypothetical protein